MNEEVEDNWIKQAKRIRGRFRTGAKWLVARQIWNVVEETLKSAESKVVKSQLKLDNQTQSTRLQNGAAGMEHYVCAMAEADISFSETGEFPTNDELAVSGYQAAVLYLQTGNTEPTNEDVLISETALLAILMAVKCPHSRRIARKNLDDYDENDWEIITAEINPNLENQTGRALKPNRLQEFMKTWARYVLASRDAIPYRWLADFEEIV